MKSSTAEIIVLGCLLTALTGAVIAGFSISILTGIFTWFAAGGVTFVTLIAYLSRRPKH